MKELMVMVAVASGLTGVVTGYAARGGDWQHRVVEFCRAETDAAGLTSWDATHAAKDCRRIMAGGVLDGILVETWDQQAKAGRKVIRAALPYAGRGLWDPQY